MVNAKTVKIGEDVYKIMNDAEMTGSEMGSIYQSTSEIRMRILTYNNRKITKRMYFKVLMHEIVHGIDFNVFFTALSDEKSDDDDLENSIDLITMYIIKNLKDIMRDREMYFEHFSQYVEMCESNITRIALLYHAILEFIDNNEKLIGEFLEVFE